MQQVSRIVVGKVSKVTCTVNGISLLRYVEWRLYITQANCACYNTGQMQNRETSAAKCHK